MNLTKFFKNISICFLLAVSFILSGFAVAGCDDGDKPATKEEITQAVSAAVDFLLDVKNAGNYSSVSEYPDGSVYKYYTEDGKIKVEYKNEVFYGQKIGGHLYKISQADDMTWHKTTDTADLSDPDVRTDNLINGFNNTSRASLWTDYDRTTKTLTATYSDGSTTVSLYADQLIVTYITNNGTTKHIINSVGDTTVTLPEKIIDDVTE